MKIRNIFILFVAVCSMPVFSQLKHVSKEEVDVAQRFIVSRGYKCDSVSEMLPLILSAGFKVHCNDFRYTYKIEDKGGHLIITVK